MIEALILCVLGTVLITWCVWMLIQANRRCTHSYEQVETVQISDGYDDGNTIGVAYHLRCTKCGDPTVKKFYY